MENIILTYFVKSNILFLPLLFAGICHLLVIHYNLFSFLKKPISPKVFGLNKTYRGFVIIGFLSSVGVFLISLSEPLLPEQFKIGFPDNSYKFGFFLGVMAMVFELPNSYLKRKLGTKAGEHPEKFKAFFYVFNQADSVIGCTLVYALFIDISWNLLLSFFIYTSIMHLVINLLFSLMNLRKNPF